jgi:hypothetical protein
MVTVISAVGPGYVSLNLGHFVFVLQVAPYQAEQQLEDDYDDDDMANGVRVLGVAYSPER